MLDIFDILFHIGLITTALVAYLIFFRRKPTMGPYREPGWNYPLKKLYAKYAVSRWRSKRVPAQLEDYPRHNQFEGWDGLSIRSTALDGSAVLVSIRKLCSRQPLAEVIVYVKLPNENRYKMKDAAIGHWENNSDGWHACGLKIQVLEPELRLRVLYNGLLTNVADGTLQHCKFNLIWTAGSDAVRHPEDWSNELAARALALDPWRDGKWPDTLDKWGDGNWTQWGVLQGRFQSYNDQNVNESIYMRTRGVRERAWSPRPSQGLRKSVNITVIAKDGTGVQIRGLSYKDQMTQCVFGNVRFPNCHVASVNDTNFDITHFGTTPDSVPNLYGIHLEAGNHTLQVLLRFNEDCMRLIGGLKHQQEILCLTFVAQVNGEPGTGVVELGYEYKGTHDVEIPKRPSLIWVSESKTGKVSYCVPFEAEAAACTNYVGGKGASLALLASVQSEQGYKVPPGYCLTVRALEKHLERNPQLLAAIRDVEDANNQYDEKVFKDRCNKAAELFDQTDITGDIKEEILKNLQALRTKARAENLGPELRFAVRSSAVGEDSEALSAAGQNETILGCVSDDDVLRGVQKCWGSMFAFTSAHYRRQNGQPCLCGGGIVIQALVTPRAAGVMFTRHPEAGDPSRLLITANYGLGESVVSGSVEPDTIIVSKSKTGLAITKIDLGTKTQRVTTTSSGVTMEDVSEAERTVACLTESEILKLASLGVAQEELWGAGRDIEWAVTADDIFLLQARPITSLDRWTEEELLHEHDTPVMAANELLTFANTGEVMPKPLTPLTYDVVVKPLNRGMDDLVKVKTVHDSMLFYTHYRCGIILYNSIYRSVPKQLDLSVRMVELAVHGRKVADEDILDTALKRRPPPLIGAMAMLPLMLKCLISSKWKMKQSISEAQKMNIDKIDTTDPLTLLNALVDIRPQMLNFAKNHAITTTGSNVAQYIAMSVLLEGDADFTAEQCNEISTLLSSGDVLSAEVPVALGKFARVLEESNRAEEFRTLDPNKAMQWLKDNIPNLHSKILAFLDQHGHRAIMEFDMYTKPWILVPSDMMKVLQSLKATKETTHKSKTNAEVVASLKTPKKSSTRTVLKWVLPLCHATVGHREATKAHLILAVHKTRLAALKLGQLLVQKWYLPNPDLVFFFRLHELRNYIQTRDPALLKKASQRYQYYPNWCKLKFNEINIDWVEPMNTTQPVVTSGDVKVKATSVCSGEVIARACVVKDLSEIDQLQQGDVLITHSTDIGWSPYFPLLSGIVTELGGLISHGAVIAREYGLPCIVGAAGVTDIFKTGDMVRLSGVEGLLERVKVDEEPSNA